MRDTVLTASRDLSCQMCITPWEGGSWFSPISYLQYRNYAYQPLNNKTFADAALAVGLGAYTLEIQFRILQDNTYGALFDYTGMTGLPKVYINSATRTLYAQNRDGSKSYAFSGFEYNVWYTFKITRLSLALVTSFSVTETSQSTTLADLSLATPATTASDYYISSSFSGNIRSLTFSGPTNYAFSVYEIYSNYGIALPVTTPRNFATETASWRDFVAIYNEQFVFGHSYRLVCRLRLAAAPAQNLSVFGGNIQNPLSLAVNASRNLNCASRLLRTSSVEYVTIGGSQALTVGQWYDVSVFFRNNQMVLKIDQAEYLSSAGYAPSTIAAPSTYVSDAPVNISNMEFWDDTTGRRMWQYPSQSEWLRLITKTNVRTDRGVFEAASTSLSWSIKTGLTAASGTVIAKINGAIAVNPSKWNASTGTFTGLATDKLAYLLAYNRQLPAAEIAIFN